jgi:hypothetical protein
VKLGSTLSGGSGEGDTSGRVGTSDRSKGCSSEAKVVYTRLDLWTGTEGGG